MRISPDRRTVAILRTTGPPTDWMVDTARGSLDRFTSTARDEGVSFSAYGVAVLAV